METDSRCCESKLYNQIEECYGRVVYSYTTQIIHAGRLHKKYIKLKWGQLILSALSTGGFVSTFITNQIYLAYAGGIFSAILLILTAYFKDIDMSATYKLHLDTSNKLWLIKEMYLSLLTDFYSLSREEIIDRRDELQKCVAKIYETAPLTDNKSFSLAQESLKNKEFQVFSRDELNKMLPETLRKSVEDQSIIES